MRWWPTGWRAGAQGRLQIATGLLTVLALIVGSFPWPKRQLGEPQFVTINQPGSLWVLLIVSSLVTIITAMTLITPPIGPQVAPRAVAGLSGVLIVGAAAAALNAMYLNQYAGPGPTSLIPIAAGCFTFFTPLAAALIYMDRHVAGQSLQVYAALAGSVVSLPLQALTWSMYNREDDFGIIRALLPTAFFGVVPLIVAMFIVSAIASAYQSRVTTARGEPRD